MPQPDPRLAAVERDAGMRRITQITWRLGLAGVTTATVLAVALGHHTPASAATPGRNTTPGGIVIPAQPPTPAGGFGQVTSGAS